MYRDHSVAVVVPAYNEEHQIGKVIDTMPDLVDWIVIVDDRSRDRTAAVVEEYAQQESRVVLLRHEVNQGVGGAIATGYMWARDHDCAIAVVMAGDAQMDPADLPALLDPIVDDVADYSKGNRLVTGEAFKKIPRIRFFGNSALSLLTKIASGYWHVADSQTGYTAINSAALKAIDWTRMYKRYGQPNDLLVKLNVYGFRVIDVPIRPVYDVGEKSGINIKKAIFTIGSLLVRLFFWRLKEKYIIRSFHPLVFFYAFGMFMFAISIVFFFRTLVLWVVQGSIPEISFLVWLFSFAISFNAISFAMWFDYDENKHLNPPMRHRDVQRSLTGQQGGD